MFQRLRKWRDRARDSLFYLPALGLVMAVVAAWIVTWLDDHLGDSLQDFPLLLRTSIDGARALLTTAAAATITVSGIVLSVTVVAVQLAASQFSPRVVATIFGSRFQQTVIAIVTGTFTFDLIILSTIHGEGLMIQITATRTISVTVALVMSVVAVMAIIAFIDRSIEVMKVGQIISRAAGATLAAIEEQHPERGTAPRGADEQVEMPDGPAVDVRAKADGWVQDVNIDVLFSTLPPGAVVRMDSTVGSFVGVGSALITAWLPQEDEATDEVDTTKPDEATEEDDATEADEATEDFDIDAVHNAFTIGEQRRARSDPTFGIRQLVDVALRALSPGINDPTTATEVILHLTEILRAVLVRDLPPRALHGEDGRRIFRPHDWSRRDWVRHAFGEIRNASSNQPAVARTLISSMGSLLDHLRTIDLEGRGEALRDEAELVLAGLEKSDAILEEDIEPIRRMARGLGLVDGDPES